MGKCVVCGVETENFDLDHYYCEKCVNIAYNVLADLDAIMKPFIESGKAKVVKGNPFI